MKARASMILTAGVAMIQLGFTGQARASDMKAILDSNDGSSAFVVADSDTNSLMTVRSDGHMTAASFEGDGFGLSNLTVKADALFPDLATLVAAVSNGQMAVEGRAVATLSYYQPTGESQMEAGGNQYIVRNAGSPGARPPADGGFIIHVGAGGYYLQGIFENNIIDVAQFGASSTNAAAANTTAIQNAVDYASNFSTIYWDMPIEIDDEIVIGKPLNFKSSSSGKCSPFVDGPYLRQMTVGKGIFKIVVDDSTFSYWSGQHGAVGLSFEKIQLLGTGVGGSRSGKGIFFDTSAYGGDFHIREFIFYDISISGFDIGIDLEGIAYLNKFYNGHIAMCNIGLRIARGNASDNGGQTRLFGMTMLGNGICIDTSETVAMDISLFGGTYSESLMGIKVHEESNLYIVGSQFEAIQDDGDGKAIYIPMVEGNPNTDTCKTISGVKFLENDYALYIEDNAAGWDSMVRFPINIDGCEIHGAMRFDSAMNTGLTRIGANGLASGFSLINFKGIRSDKLLLRESGQFADVHTPRQVQRIFTTSANVIVDRVPVPNNDTFKLWWIDRKSLSPSGLGNATVIVSSSYGSPTTSYFGVGYIRNSDGNALLTWANTAGSTQYVTIEANDGGSGNETIARAAYSVD